MVSKENIWFAFKGGKCETTTGFYSTEDLNWVKILEDNLPIIKSEIENYIDKNKIKPYFNESLVSKKDSWKTSGFFFWTWKIRKNMKQCPQTMRILREIPGILSTSISILEPNVTIKAHHGDTNAIVRAHLGIKVPAGLPACGFRVNNEEKEWEVGKVLAFNDAAEHSAWNHSDKRRYVLLIDVIRPEFANKKYRISSKVLAALFMQAFIQKLPFVKRFPRPIYIGLIYFPSWIINVTLYLRNRGA